MSSPSRPKPESRARPEGKLAVQAARTRARLIETALDLLGKQEFQNQSLDAIAARAGVTKGAIYGHFRNKDDLLLAALNSMPEGQRPVVDGWPADRKGTVRKRLRRLGESVLNDLAQTGPSGGQASVEMMFHALSNEGLKTQLGEFMMQGRASMEKRLRALFAPEELPMSYEAFAVLLGTLIPGILFGRMFGRERVSNDLILEIFEGLAGPKR